MTKGSNQYLEVMLAGYKKKDQQSINVTTY
jgi:hypothetical protein